MLRGSTCVTGTWSKRCVDQLPHRARTIPTDFYRIDTAVPWVRLLSSLFGASSLFTGIRLRESAFFETPTGGILDRYGPSAWSNRGTMVCPPVLLIYEIANESFYPNRCGSRTSFQPMGRNLTNRESRRAKYDLCGLSDHSQKSTRKNAWVTDAKVDFDKKTASVSFDPE
jgi:hypothetical protein